MATDTPVLYGVRCTDTDPIGHRAGKVYAEGASWEVIARLAVANPCYELVTSADGGQTWWPVAGPEDPKLIHGVAGFGPCPGCGERCPVVNDGVICMTRTHNGLPCLGNGLPARAEP